MTDYSICVGMPTVEALHLGQPVTIRREQDQAATIRAEYAVTARKCPPYCIQPMQLAAGVETLGELEVLECLKRIHDGESRLMVVDSRTGLVCEGHDPRRGQHPVCAEHGRPAHRPARRETDSD